MKDRRNLKQRVRRLERERRRLIELLLEPDEMIAGSLYRTYRKCGKAGCRCARGDLHGPFLCLSTAEGGTRTVRHVRQEDENWVQARSVKYRSYQKALARIRKADADVMAALKKLRDGYLSTYM